MDPEMLMPPGQLQSTTATENTLYEAACQITDEFPFFGLGLSMYIDDASQFVVRIGGPVAATVSATLGAVAALHGALDRDSNNPLGVSARRQFPQCVKRLFAGVPCMDAVAPMLKEERQMVEAHGDTEALWEFGPVEPAMYGPYPMPMMAQGLVAVLQSGTDMARFAEEYPFSIAFAMSDDAGEAWTAFVGGWPSQAVTTVITLLNAVIDFVDSSVKERPELKGLKEHLLEMVRKAWKTRNITGIVEDVLLGRKL